MSRFKLLASVGLVLLLGLGLVLRSCAVPVSDRPEPVDPDRSPDDGSISTDDTDGRDVGPTRVVRGVPQGWRHDADGARAAAISAVALTGDIVRAGFITRADMIAALATPAFAPELAQDTTAQVEDLVAEIGSDEVVPSELTWLESPLTATVTTPAAADNPDRAEVEVWSVLVVAAPDGIARQGWRTVTLNLSWVDGDWRIDGWSSRPGPTPALPPLADVADVSDIEATAGWPPSLLQEVE